MNTVVGWLSIMETRVVIRRSTGVMLGNCVHTMHKGWKFLPYNMGEGDMHYPSRKFWPSFESCLPRWVHYDSELITLTEWNQRKAQKPIPVAVVPDIFTARIAEVIHLRTCKCLTSCCGWKGSNWTSPIRRSYLQKASDIMSGLEALDVSQSDMETIINLVLQ